MLRNAQRTPVTRSHAELLAFDIFKDYPIGIFAVPNFDDPISSFSNLLRFTIHVRVIVRSS